jgi:predicted O-linked N-acetylglucosamine transferase (SPINDLY family)
MLTEDQRAELQRAVEHHLAERFDQAEPLYEHIQASAPDDYQVNHLLGTLRHQQGRPGEAVVLLSKARRCMPFSAPTLMCLGVALGALGRREEAEKALRLSVNLDPESCEGWANLGANYAVMGNIDKAISSFKRALTMRPDYVAGLTGLGAVLHLAARSGEAVACHSRALEIEPGNAKALFGRGQALQALHRTAEAIADFDAHLLLRPDHHETRSFRLFSLNYRDDLSREALFAEHLAYGRAVEAEALKREPPPPFPNSPDPRRRLRVGFLSPDLRSHSVAYFVEPLLNHLDRAQFEVFLYHDHFSVDAVSERLRAGAAVWRRFAGQADGVVERAIRADAPDILVDLAGHTGFNRLAIFARRLAPVQVSYLGYPNTTGLAAMDYRFTDGIADPPGDSDAWHSERLVRFAPTAWSYLPPEEAPQPSRSPDPSGGAVTFGSFNALSKVGPGTLRLWREVLEAVPGARLLIKSSGMDAAHWGNRLAGAGISADRVRLLPMTRGIAEHLACYSGVDVALDTFPYHGTTTTCEALWMGVPVVTLSGDRHAARVGASLLGAVGHPEWIARTAEDYVRVASGLAADRGRLDALRSGLRAEVLGSRLMDHAGQARSFGASLRRCWAAWCEARESAEALPAA